MSERVEQYDFPSSTLPGATITASADGLAVTHPHWKSPWRIESSGCTIEAAREILNLKTKLAAEQEKVRALDERIAELEEEVEEWRNQLSDRLDEEISRAEAAERDLAEAEEAIKEGSKIAFALKRMREEKWGSASRSPMCEAFWQMPGVRRALGEGK